MNFKDYSKEFVAPDRSQRKIDIKKSKRHTKTALKQYDKEHDEAEEIYENFVKFDHKHK